MVHALKWSLFASVLVTATVISIASLAHQFGWDPAIRHAEVHALTLFGHRITGTLNVQPVTVLGDDLEVSEAALPELAPATRLECVVVE